MNKSLNKKFSCTNKKTPKVKRFCVSCRNHNLKSPIIGHKYVCLYASCDCAFCRLTNHVKIVSLKERKSHKAIEKAQQQPPADINGDRRIVRTSEDENILETIVESISDTESESELMNADLFNDYNFQISELEMERCNMLVFDSGELQQQFQANAYEPEPLERFDCLHF